MHKVERSKPTSAQRNHDMTSCDWLSLVASFSIVAIATIRGRCTLSQGDLNHHLIYGSLRPLESSNQTASRAVQLFLHSSQQSVSVLYNGPSSPQNCPLPWGSGPPRSITWFLGSIQSQTRTVSHSRFAQLTADSVCPCTLQWVAPFPSPPHNCPSHGECCPLSNTRSLGPPESSIQMASRSV